MKAVLLSLVYLTCRAHGPVPAPLTNENLPSLVGYQDTISTQHASTSRLEIASCPPPLPPLLVQHTAPYTCNIHHHHHHHYQSQSSTTSPHGPPSYSTNNGQVILTSSSSSSSLSSAHTTKGDPEYNMATFFSTIKRSFKDVGVEGEQIPTTEFLEACESLVSLFDLLGSTAFAAVQKDMNGNIKKIRDRQTSHPKESDTLQNLCNNELAEGKRNASGGLLWLHRGLEFTEKALRKNIENPGEELSISFTNSYGETLKKHHNMIVKGVFSLAMKACPYRVDFYKKLGENQTEVNTQLEEWLTALELNNAILTRYLNSIGQKIGS